MEQNKKELGELRKRRTFYENPKTYRKRKESKQFLLSFWGRFLHRWKKICGHIKAVLKQEKRLVGLLCSRDLFKNKGGIIHIWFNKQLIFRSKWRFHQVEYGKNPGWKFTITTRLVKT